MKTQINGTDAPWTPAIEAKWTATMAHVIDDRPVTQANYFTPRPYQDKYCTGSREEGFTYTRMAPNREASVFQVIITRHVRIGGDQ